MAAHRMAILFALLASVAPAAAQDPGSPPIPIIVTSGDALVRRTPDQAVVIAAVETRSKTPQDAQKQNAEVMTAVQQHLSGLGIARDAMKTLGYNVHQEADYVNGRRVPRGYLARNALEVRVDRVERLGEVLDVAVQAGATSVGDVRFDLRNRSEAEREALKLAVADARSRADALAAGLGRTVDRVVKIEDNVQPALPRPVMMTAAQRGVAVETPVEPGTIEIRAHVTLTATFK